MLDIELIIKITIFCTLNIFFIKSFITFSEKIKINSVENHRSLHKGSIPTSAGMIFSILFLLYLFFSNSETNFENGMHQSFMIVCFLCSFLGFMDDVFDVNFLIKLFSQFFIVSFLFLTLNDFKIYLQTEDFLKNILLLILLVWILNSFNFVDGIDGLLSSISIIIFLSIAVNLQLNNSSIFVSETLVIVSSILITFLLFNWSPAKIFMGDAGSLFLGSIFCIVFFYSIQNELISFFYCLIMVSYILVETTITLIFRIWKNKNWFKAHKSHSYQNLTKILGSHSKTTLIISFFHLIWLFPMALISSIFSGYEIMLLIISIIPSMIFVLIFGPLYSDE